MIILFFLNAVFHVTDPSGRKVTDKTTIDYIEKVGTYGIAEISEKILMIFSCKKTTFVQYLQKLLDETQN